MSLVTCAAQALSRGHTANHDTKSAVRLLRLDIVSCCLLLCLLDIHLVVVLVLLVIDNEVVRVYGIFSTGLTAQILVLDEILGTRRPRVYFIFCLDTA